MKKILTILLTGILIFSLVGCGSKKEVIELPDITEQLSNGGSELDYTTFEVTGKGDNKLIKVTAAYKNEIMIVGKITGIRNIIEINLKDDYSKIELNIIQEEPSFSSVKYIYENNSWDKHVQ